MSGKNDEQEKLEGKLVQSIKIEDLKSLACDAAEYGIDIVIDNEAIKAIPIVGTLIKLTKGASSIRDRLYVRKLLHFLQQVSDTTQKQREVFIQKNCCNTKQFEEAVLLILEQADDMNKSVLIGKIFKACILGKISYGYVLKLSTMVNKVFWDDLESFINIGDNLPIDEHRQSLVMAGLYNIDIHSSLGRNRYSFGGVQYKISFYGAMLIKIVNQ